MLTLDQVNQLNPWWANPSWAPSDDPHLAAAAATPFRWDPRPFDSEDLSSGAVICQLFTNKVGKVGCGMNACILRATGSWR